MYEIYTKTHGQQLFLQGLEGLAGLEMVFGGWLDVAWDLEAVFWRLMAGFGWPGGPRWSPELRQRGVSRGSGSGLWA